VDIIRRRWTCLQLLYGVSDYFEYSFMTISIARRSKADIGIIVRFDISLSFARLSGSI